MANVWYFAYGSNKDKSILEKNKIKIFDSQVATLKGFNLATKRNNKNSLILDSNIIEDPHNFVEGIAYLINEDDMSKIDKLEQYPKNMQKRKLSISLRGQKDGQLMPEAYLYLQEQNTSNIFRSGHSNTGGIMKLKSSNRNLKITPQTSSSMNNYIAAFESYLELYNDNRLNEIKYYEENIDNERTKNILKTIKSLLSKDPQSKDKEILDNTSSVVFDNILELEKRGELPKEIVLKFINWINKLYEYKTPMNWFYPEKFDNLTQFFTRKLSPGKLEDCKKSSKIALLSSPCEGSLVSTGYLDKNIYIKNMYTDIQSGIKELGLTLDNYIFLNFKLFRSYYHRAHSPVDGKITKIWNIKPFDSKFFGKNATVGLEIETDFDKIYMFAIGELNVQAFTLLVDIGDNIKKTDELGYFKYGSQILILIPSVINGNNNMRVGRTYFIGSPLIIK